jgi:hypothetical protein
VRASWDGTSLCEHGGDAGVADEWSWDGVADKLGYGPVLVSYLSVST